MADKVKKTRDLEAMKSSFAKSATVVVANFNGLTIKETDLLRKAAKLSGAGVRISKNTLAQIASKGTSHEVISEYFKGQTLIAYSKDAVSAAKIFSDFAKKNDKLKILGGSFEGSKLDSNGVVELANTPSLDQSRGRIVGLLVANASNIARLTTAPATKLARVFSAYGEKA